VDAGWKPLFSKDDIKGRGILEPAPDERSVGQTPPHPLPNNFSRRAHEDEVPLPNFAKDFSEFALGAMIERTSDAWDLHVTTFFLCHGLLEPKVGGSAQSGDKVNPEVT